MSRCLVGFKDCDCDDPVTLVNGLEYTPEFCECHDCFVCGAIDCGGH